MLWYTKIIKTLLQVYNSFVNDIKVHSDHTIKGSNYAMTYIQVAHIISREVTRL